MHKVLLFVVGVAVGSLLTLAFRLPILPPLDENAATVLASLASTVLAVAGAFWLWGHQADRRSADIRLAAVPVFQNFYVAMLQVRAFVDLTSTKAVYEVLRAGAPPGAYEELTPKELLRHRHEQFFQAIAGATREASIATQHWDGMQDALLSVRPPALNSLLMLYRYTRHAIEELPALSARAKGTSVWHSPPVLDALDRQRLDEAISMLAQHLNALDGGNRDERGAELVRASEGAYEVYLTASKPLTSLPPEQEAALLTAAGRRPPRAPH